MSRFKVILCGTLLLGLFGIIALAQREARRDTPAPTDKAASWTMAEIRSDLNAFTINMNV